MMPPPSTTFDDPAATAHFDVIALPCAKRGISTTFDDPAATAHGRSAVRQHGQVGKCARAG